MRIRFGKPAITTAGLFMLLAVNFCLAGDIRANQTTYGIKLGLISPGVWTVGDFEYDSDTEYSIGGFLDYKLGPKITGGLALNINGFGAYETSSTLFDLGVTLKAMVFSDKSKFTFMPGIGISYGHLGKMYIYESSNYMILSGFVDAVIATPRNFSWFGELGLFGSPNGGNDDADMYLDPGLMVKAGIVF